MTMHVIRFSGNERLSECLSWHLFERLRRKRIGRLKAVREVHKGGFVTNINVLDSDMPCTTCDFSAFPSLILTVPLAHLTRTVKYKIP